MKWTMSIRCRVCYKVIVQKDNLDHQQLSAALATAYTHQNHDGETIEPIHFADEYNITRIDEYGDLPVGTELIASQYK